MRDLNHAIVICRDCDIAYRRVSLTRGETARCLRCDAVLQRYLSADPDAALALVITGTILFTIANLTPILTIEIAGVETKADIWQAVRSLEQGWISFAAIGLAVTTFLVPALQLSLLLWVLLFARARAMPPLFGPVMTVLHWLRPWSMTEVFLLGALVAVIKLSNWVPIVAGAGIWAIAALTLVLAILGRCDPSSWWSVASRRTA